MSADVGIESTDAGWLRVLFSLASAAALTWAIMNPELRPASGVRNGGRPENAVFVSFSMRLSLMAPSSETPSVSTSAASAMGSP